MVDLEEMAVLVLGDNIFLYASKSSRALRYYPPISDFSKVQGRNI